jgi:hypothetical protein
METTKTVVVYSCPEKYTVMETMQGVKQKNGKTVQMLVKKSVKIEPEHGHFLFPVGSTEGQSCGVCGWALIIKQAQALFMWPSGPRLRNTLQQPILRQGLRQRFCRPAHPDWIRDVYDGDLCKEMDARLGVTDETFHSALYIKITNDPADVTDRGHSLTPVFGTVMSFGGKLRGKRGSYIILILLPKGFKNVHIALKVFFALPDNPWGEGGAPTNVTWDDPGGIVDSSVLTYVHFDPNLGWYYPNLG